jgi:hypothetical protein
VIDTRSDRSLGAALNPLQSSVGHDGVVYVAVPSRVRTSRPAERQGKRARSNLASQPVVESKRNKYWFIHLRWASLGPTFRTRRNVLPHSGTGITSIVGAPYGNRTWDIVAHKGRGLADETAFRPTPNVVPRSARQ